MKRPLLDHIVEEGSSIPDTHDGTRLQLDRDPCRLLALIGTANDVPQAAQLFASDKRLSIQPLPSSEFETTIHNAAPMLALAVKALDVGGHPNMREENHEQSIRQHWA